MGRAQVGSEAGIETRVIDLTMIDLPGLLELVGADRPIVNSAAESLVREIDSPLIVSLAGSNS